MSISGADVESIGMLVFKNGSDYVPVACYTYTLHYVMVGCPRER